MSDAWYRRWLEVRKPAKGTSSGVDLEGYEPEVLVGAAKALARTRIVTVDAWEERQGKPTASECLNFLYQLGFELEFFYLTSRTLNLRNRALG
jgi:hypothetical protein